MNALDLLDMDYINSLPQPLFAKSGSTWWPVHDIEVQTGLLRLEVCGMLDLAHVGDFLWFRDGCGKEHCADDFYVDAEREAA
jgi:hypothetical protein